MQGNTRTVVKEVVWTVSKERMLLVDLVCVERGVALRAIGPILPTNTIIRS